jgi:hypothetical protein
MNFRTTLAIATMIFSTATSANAATVTSAKKINLFQNNTTSPFFTKSPNNAVTFQSFAQSPADPGSTITFTPDTTNGQVQASVVTSLTTNGSFLIVGNSTAAGNWTNGNGIPQGITLTFNTQLTISVGAGSPANSFLTVPSLSTGSSSPNLGDGIGITQGGSGSIGTIDSNNLTTPVNPFSETLAVSAMSVTGISFSGTLADTNYGFIPGTVGNFGPYVLRSNGWTEAGETAGLVSETGPTDPLNPGRPTIGFGVPSSDPSEIGRGLGVVASNVSIENGFNDVSINGHSTIFPRQIGAWTLTPQNGTIGLKGIGYEYDVNFTIVPPGDYNKNGVVDAADYALWRKGDLAADSNGDNAVDQTDYDFWGARFGNGNAAGAGSGLSSTSVPEPTSLMLVLLGMLASCSRRRIGRTRL